MATKLQITANRSNARKSTGPKTREGRRSSSQNGVRHGLNQPPPHDLILKYLEPYAKEYGCRHFRGAPDRPRARPPLHRDGGRANRPRPGGHRKRADA